MTRPRLLIAGGAVIVVALVLAAWALAGDSPAQGGQSAQGAQYSTALGAPNEPDSVVTSRAVFAHSPSAILVRDDAPADVVARSAEAAHARHIPLLTVGPTSVAPVRAELTRLGVATVAAVDPATIPDVGHTVVGIDAVGTQSAPLTEPTLILISSGPGSAAAAATATKRAAN